MKLGNYETGIFKALKDRIIDPGSQHPKRAFWWPLDGWITDEHEIKQALVDDGWSINAPREALPNNNGSERQDGTDAKPEPKEPTKSFEDELEQALVIWGQQCYNHFGGETQKKEAIDAIKAAVERVIGEDESIKERNYILDECADDWEKGRNQLRAEQRKRLGNEK